MIKKMINITFITKIIYFMNICYFTQANLVEESLVGEKYSYIQSTLDGAKGICCSFTPLSIQCLGLNDETTYLSAADIYRDLNEKFGDKYSRVGGLNFNAESIFNSGKKYDIKNEGQFNAKEMLQFNNFFINSEGKIVLKSKEFDLNNLFIDAKNGVLIESNSEIESEIESILINPTKNNYGFPGVILLGKFNLFEPLTHNNENFLDKHLCVLGTNSLIFKVKNPQLFQNIIALSPEEEYMNNILKMQTTAAHM